MRKRTDIAMAYLTKEQKEHAMQIAARIDAIIAKPEIVKGDFYKESGVSSATLSQWRNGTYYPSQKKLADAAEYLNVSVKYLEYGNEPQKEKPTAQGGELTEKDVALVKWFRSLPEEKLRAILVSQDAPEELFD